MFGLMWLAATAFAGDCPAGQVELGAPQTTCCWPGQAVREGVCVGIPRCPEGMRTLPDRCLKADGTYPRGTEPTRNVMFAGSAFSGQLLFIDDVERGRLPNAFMLTAGIHHWSVKNTLQQVLLEGEVKVRVGDDSQVVVVEEPAAE